MKLPKQISKNNPLEKILGLYSTEFDDLTLDNLKDTANLLAKSGIKCEEYSEVFTCLKLLEEFKVVELLEEVDKATGYSSYKIKRTYET